MKKPRKLKRFKSDSLHWCMNWRNIPGGMEYKTYINVCFSRKYYPVPFWEVFLEIIPQYSIVLN